MNPNLTEIAFVLDRSGSMASVVEPTIAGFNHFLAEQQQAPGRARLTLVLFDDEYLVPAASMPIEEFVPLDTETYVPRNSTALLDAIGHTIDELGARLEATPEADRPGTVIVAILTDGLENASERYTWKSVSQRVKHQTKKYGWEFLFLGANQDAIATAAQLHIGAHNSATYVADSAGSGASTAAMSRKSSAYRARKLGATNPLLQRDAEAPMSDLLREEDEQRRSGK